MFYKNTEDAIHIQTERHLIFDGFIERILCHTIPLPLQSKSHRKWSALSCQN
jgi:hypothetical protein